MAKQKSSYAQKKALRNANMGSMTAARAQDDIHSWMEDGVDHILISPFGATALGRALATTSGSWIPQPESKSKVVHLPFSVQFIGEFNTIDGMLLWLQLQAFPRVEDFRKVTGKNIYHLKCTAGSEGFAPRPVINSRAIIAMAMMERIIQNDVLLMAMKSNNLPFDAYDVNSTTCRREIKPWNNRWCLPIYDAIKQCLDTEGVPAKVLGEDGLTTEYTGFNHMFWRDENIGLFEGAVHKYQLDAIRKKQEIAKQVEEARQAAEKAKAQKAMEESVSPISNLGFLTPAENTLQIMLAPTDPFAKQEAVDMFAPVNNMFGVSAEVEAEPLAEPSADLSDSIAQMTTELPKEEPPIVHPNV